MSISETTSIRSFITSSMLISVPRYQRNYSWTEKQLSEFWDDVESVSINSSGNPVNRHFLGLLSWSQSIMRPSSMKLLTVSSA